MNLYIPYIPVGNVQSDFYEIVDEFIKKFIAFLCGQVTSQEFVTMDYVIQTTINTYDILNGEGLGLVEKLGMSVTRVIITNPDLMDRRVQKAMEEEKIAIAQGQAVKAKASADGNALKIKADAEAEARKIRAHAEAIALELVNKQEYGDVMALVQKLIDSDPRIDPNLAAQIAGTIGKTKRLPPGITTLVEKGEVGVMINPSTPPNTSNDKKKGGAQ
jgi:regulator of protease activity HflC (stomatin/prohibitin superfamily)